VLSQENRNDLIFRKVRGILNKLTPENFKKLSDDLLGTELNSSVILKGVILLIFDKALDEPKYSSMYAQLCKRLSKEAPNFEPDDQPCTFRLLLLNKCKAEFENRSAAAAAANEHLDHVHSPEDEERRQLAKRKMLGNIKFIGELAKLEILSENILHKCIQQLLVDKRRRGDTAQDMSEDLECLCQILRTCGRILDTDKGQKLMGQYFERMKVLAENTDLPPRIRFMLKDVIELRADVWVPRKATTVEGPMPINQIRPADDYLLRERRNAERDVDRDRVASNELFRHRMKVRSGLDDMLASINLGPSSTSLIPTHPDKFNFNPNGYGVRDGSFRAHNNQRGGGGYNMYNNQRGGGFNKHNQNNQHSNNNAQYNNGKSSNKELAPRFKKSLMAAREQNLGDLELRPSANSMMFNQPSVNKQPTNMVLNSNRSPVTPDLNITTTNTNVNKPVMSTPTPLLKEPLPIKQASTEKPKQTKKDKGPNKEEVLKKLTTLVDEFLQDNVNLIQSLETYKEHKIPDKYAKDAMLHVFNMCIDKSDSNREKVVKFVSALRNDSMVNASTCQEAIKNFCNNLDESEGEAPLEKGAVVLACAVREQIMSLGEVAALTENGAHHPLFLLVLQQLHKALDKQELVELFNLSKVNLLSQLPEADRTKERLAEILEDRDLTFLYPLLRIQAELARQLAADPQPTQFYKWIKDNLEPSSYTDAGFINALMTVLLKYMMQEAGSVGADSTDKVVQEKEKALLKRYTVVLQHFLHERQDLQVTAVYSLQSHCHALGFPKGLLLRWFMALYDLEVVEEEAFLQWKEDLTDAYPGKGQALFQVNQWLTWLQEAESEDDEADD